MALVPVTDPEEAARARDALKAQNAGVDYDSVSNSRDYNNTLQTSLQTGAEQPSGFVGPPPSLAGTAINSFFKGRMGNMVVGAAQGAAHAGNWIEKQLGLDPNTGITGGEGIFSDKAVNYADANARVYNSENEDARAAQGKTGYDWGELAGSLFAPPITRSAGVGGGLVRRATDAVAEGTAQSALQPVANTSQGYGTEKAKQTLAGAGTAGAVGAVLGVPDTISNWLGSKASDIARNVDVGNQLGANLSLSEAAPGWISRNISHLAGNSLVGGSIGNQARSTLSTIGDTVQNAADTIAGGAGKGADRFDVGGVLRNALNDSADRFQQDSNAMYRQSKASPWTGVNMGDTIDAMQGPANAFQTNPALGRALANNKMMYLSNLLSNFDENGKWDGPKTMAFNEAQRLRSEIGSMMGRPELLNDIPRSELSAVYGKLSDSMHQSLDGQPQAQKAFEDATNFYKAGRARIDNVLQPLVDRPANESITDAVQNMVKNNAGGVDTIRSSVKPQEWDQVAGYIFRNLGQPTAANRGADNEGFSATKFLTDFNKLRENKPAFDAAFGGTRYEDMAPTYQALADFSGNVKNMEKLANTSRSGYMAQNAAMLGGLFSEPHIAVPALAGYWGLSKTLSSPKAAQLVARMGRRYQAMQGAPRVANRYIKQQLAKLSSIQAAHLIGEQQQGQ